MSRPSCAPSRRGAARQAARRALRALLAVCLAAISISNPATADPPPAPPAVILEHDTGRVVGYLPLDPGEQIGVSFIHSVDRLPVQDWYVLREPGLVQVSTRFLQIGAGMGHLAGQGHGQPDGDWWEITGLERPIGALPLRIGPASVDHRLHYRGHQIPLSHCWPGDRLTLKPAGPSAPVTTPAPLIRCPTDLLP